MKRILISSAGLPSNKIGSWTNRISQLLLANPTFFDWVISPTESSANPFIFCQKIKPFPKILLRLLKKSPAISAADSYLKCLDRLALKESQLHLVVMDDMVLLEAMACWKLLHRKEKKIRLDFSFHGHSFVLPTTWGEQVDQVLFLTKSGYLDTLFRNEVFTPMVKVVGNGTDGKVFFPLTRDSKNQQKLALGYQENDIILLWLSNPRPKKGLNLFLALGKKLRNKYPELKILIIGNSPEFQCPDENWRAIGKIPNPELAQYLQIGDFYCFTSLWKEGFGLSLIEAAKCGNQVIASQLGGIPDVVHGLPGAHLVSLPNSLEAWEATFDKAWSQRESFVPDPDFLNNFHEVKDWQFRFIQELST